MRTSILRDKAKWLFYIVAILYIVCLSNINRGLRVDNDIMYTQNFVLLGKYAELDRRYNQLDLVLECESGYRHHDLWGDKEYKYPAYGIAQFQERTFYYLADLSGVEGLHYYSKGDQVILLDWAIENGYGGYWTCYNIKIAKKED